MSDADKIALRNNTAAISCRLVVKAKDNLPAITLTENNSVKNWEYTDERLVPKKGFIGQFVGRTLDGELQNISDGFDINGREIELWFGVVHIGTQNEYLSSEENVSLATEEYAKISAIDNEGNTTNWYDFGTFIVTTPEDDEVKDNTKFECMDYTKLFNKEFDGNYTDGTFTTSYNDLMGVNLTDEERESFVVTPVTALWVAQYTCAQVGVELATTTFTNYNFSININPFQAGESCRDVMKAVAQLAFSWVRIGWDNRCYIDFNKNNLIEGKNLLNVTAASATINGITFTVNEDKSVTINGTNSGSISWFRLAPDFVLPAGTYTLSNSNDNAAGNTFLFIDDNSHFARENIDTRTFSQDTTIKPYVRVQAGSTVNNQTIYPMIEDGNAYTGFEPYGISKYNVLDKNQYFSLETIGDTPEINAVAFGMTNIDGETAIYKKDGTDGENCIYLYDNPFLYSFALRQQAANTGGVLFGLSYAQLKTETIGHPWFIGTELIDVKDMENNPHYTYPFNKVIKYSGHIRSEINTIDDTEVEKTLAYTSSTIKSSRQASIEVNKQEGRITAIAGKVDEISDDMGNYYTKGEIDELIADEFGLTNQYKTSGGANKFRNTGLWYKEDNGTDYEYWSGSVDVADDSNSASGTVMMLQNSTLTQTLSNIPNGKYTVSFKHAQLNPTATLTVLINNTDYSDKLSSGNTFEQTIDVSTNSIEISFVCNVNNGWKVYELMCNVGEAALVWMQHADEVRTDTVNISKGITITSTTTDAVFKANADGIRVENRSKNTTTNFLEDGMETENATIKKQAKISGALHTIVGSQTWISGIL